MKLKLITLLSVLFLFACKDNQDFSKSFAIPADDPQALQQARIQAATQTEVKDSLLADGTRIVNVRVTIPPAGTPPKDTVPVPPVDTTKRIIGIGINTLPWVPLEKLTMFSTVRLYVASGWIWRPNGLFVQPFFQAETEYAHGLDDYFERAKRLGIEVLPCVNMTPDWYNGYSQGIGSNDYPPIKKGLDRTDPNSYKDWAEFWFQFVARYGSVKHPDNVLRIDETPRWNGDIKNVKRSGLGLVKAVQIGNEMMRWWDKGTDKDAAYMYPEEFAAMMYAAYQACKRADPNIVVVMGSTTNFELPYLKAMKVKFDKLDVKFQSDKLAINHYSSRFNLKGVHPPTWKLSSACLPSEDKDFPTVYEVVAFGKSLGIETWMTEFGADSKAPSWMHISLPGITDEEAQGKLLVETYREYFKAGVERCYAFMAADEPGSNGGLWQTSGVLRNKASGWSEKPSWYAMKNYVESLKKK